MNKTWKEITTDKIRKKIKKRKYLKWPLSLYMYAVFGLYDIGNYFFHNGKRFACILTVFLFFIVSSSFSFQNMNDELMEPEKFDEWLEIQENYEYVPTMLGISQSDIIDDNDVLDGYNNDELDVQDEIDHFSLDELLDSKDITYKDVQTEEERKLSKDDWQLVLVNKQHHVPDDFELNLGKLANGMQCDARIIDEVMAMMQAAKDSGINLVICSPYRDYNRQTVLFNRKIDYYMGKGYSYLEAYKIASITVTVPGASEHQIGLALDIASDTYTLLDTGFGNTEAGKWLKEHGCEYGFILRYPLGKEYITGIQYEPWHFRYVGKQAATAIMKQGLTLEEFLEDLD